jgi:hypothetical protein
MERGEIGEMGSVGVANVERAAGEVEVTGVDLELVAGNARGDGAAIAAAMGVGVANVERAAGDVGVTGVDMEVVAGNACCDRIRHLKFPYLGVTWGLM